MLNTIKGIYNNGKLVLEETPQVSGPVEVLVTFTEDEASINKKNNGKRVFGIGKGLVQYMSPNFNDPLEDLKDYM